MIPFSSPPQFVAGFSFFPDWKSHMIQLSISKGDLWFILSYGMDDEIDHEDEEAPSPEKVETVRQLVEAKLIHPVLVDQYMSENHVGGDDVVSFVDATLAAVKEGYTVATWNGEDAEVLVVGYKPEAVEVTD